MADEVFNLWRINVDLCTDVLEHEAQQVLRTIESMAEVAGVTLEEVDE